MSKKYQLVVFDWEGTLSDTLGQVLHCVAEEARRLNMGEFDEDLARHTVELGLANAIQKVFPDSSLNQQEELLNAVQHALMIKHGEVYLIPGAKGLVTRLYEAGVDLAVASNKSQQSLTRAIQLSGMDELIKVVRGAGQWASKPHPEMLLDILTYFDVQPKDALLVGDSVTDIEMAVSLKVDAVGVSFYQRQNDFLLAAGAKIVCDSYASLTEFLSGTL